MNLESVCVGGGEGGGAMDICGQPASQCFKHVESSHSHLTETRLRLPTPPLTHTPHTGAAHIGAMYTAFLAVARACGTPAMLAALALGQVGLTGFDLTLTLTVTIFIGAGLSAALSHLEKLLFSVSGVAVGGQASKS